MDNHRWEKRSISEKMEGFGVRRTVVEFGIFNFGRGG